MRTSALPDQAKERLARALDALLRTGLKHLGQNYSDQQIQLFIEYVLLLDRWNSAFNLTAVKNPEVMLTRHLLDSLSVLPCLKGGRFIDVGTGAGLPGIALAIAEPQRHFVLLDSNGKKIRFLFQVRSLLGLVNVQEIQERAEQYRKEGSYDGVISRAFTSLSGMVRATDHMLRPGGRFYAMKGRFPDRELSELPKHYNVDAVVKLNVPGLDEERHLIIIQRS